MNDELGTIILKGKIYNLDKMNSDELRSLILELNKNYKKIEREIEILTDNYHSEEEVNLNE